jgi:hypothetical protein
MSPGKAVTYKCRFYELLLEEKRLCYQYAGAGADIERHRVVVGKRNLMPSLN